MTFVDAWLAYSQCTGSTEIQSEFYAGLSTELIDNDYDILTPTSVRRRRRAEAGEETGSPPPLLSALGLPRCGVDDHLTPTKKTRTARDTAKRTGTV